MSFLEGPTHLDGSFLEPAAQQLAGEHAEASSSMPVSTAAAAQALAPHAQALASGQLGFLDNRLMIPGTNIVLTYKQVVFVLAAVALAYLLWKRNR